VNVAGASFPKLDFTIGELGELGAQPALAHFEPFDGLQAIRSPEEREKSGEEAAILPSTLTFEQGTPDDLLP